MLHHYSKLKSWLVEAMWNAMLLNGNNLATVLSTADTCKKIYLGARNVTTNSIQYHS
jgi:hypothetical protein